MDGSFHVPLNGYFIHGFCGTYIFTINVCALIRTNDEIKETHCDEIINATEDFQYLFCSIISLDIFWGTVEGGVGRFHHHPVLGFPTLIQKLMEEDV